MPYTAALLSRGSKFGLVPTYVFFISFQQTEWLCTAIAASLHYFFLASHLWMNVMSYDVYRTFAGSSCVLTRVRDKTKYFPRYAAYAWGTPMLIVGVCLFIDLSHLLPPSITIGGYLKVWGLVSSVGRASDFGSEGLGLNSRRLCCEFYPWER